MANAIRVAIRSTALLRLRNVSSARKVAMLMRRLCKYEEEGFPLWNIFDEIKTICPHPL